MTTILFCYSRLRFDQNERQIFSQVLRRTLLASKLIAEIIQSPWQKNIDEYFGQAEEFVVDVDEDADVEVHELDLDSMTRSELIETAEDWKVDIDTKATKAEIKAQLEEELF